MVTISDIGGPYLVLRQTTPAAPGRCPGLGACHDPASTRVRGGQAGRDWARCPPVANAESALTLSQSDLRARHFARYQTILPGMIARLGWDRAQIDAFQADALRQQLRHAKAHSPWHAARLASIDVDAAGFRLDTLPTMRKPDLMANWDDIVTIPGATREAAEHHVQTTVDHQYVWGDNVLMVSGGTGGSPGLYVYDFDAMALNWAAMSRSMIAVVARRFGGVSGLRTAAIGSGVSNHGSYVMGRIFSDPANETISFSSWQTPAHIFPALNDFSPDLMFVTSSYVMQLVAGHRQGTVRISPKLIFFSSEHLTDAARAAAHATWPDALLFTCWGTTEGAGTFPCPTGEGFHISEDGIIIEPIDADGNPSKPGDWSHAILLTNLYNRALPLFRYYIDDVFEFDDTPCACGSAYRKVRHVHGRSLERFAYGTLSINPSLVELAILEQPIIQQYQIVQTRGGVCIRYSADVAADEARMRVRVARDLAGHGLADPTIEIERLAELARTKVGKLQRYVPLAPA